MKVLLVTEKFHPEEIQRDGGARLVSSLQHALGNTLQIMQFGYEHQLNSWCFNYPYPLPNRFERRLANAKFIGEKIKAIEKQFTHIIFIHISMQFSSVIIPLKKELKIITFPMFLTPSYQLSKEKIPNDYTKMEKAALKNSTLILTPSHFEKHQLINYYGISEKNIRVIPRGIDEHYIRPFTEKRNDCLRCCSIGSIKPQKNTLELIHLFSNIHKKYPKSILQIIGPVQNIEYYEKVCNLIIKLKLTKPIELTGYITPQNMPKILKDTHIHLSTSLCETFGRSIFETLAAGIPNIVRAQNNAAFEFLCDAPYIRFVNNSSEALSEIDNLFPCISTLSSLATEIGPLYNDRLLSQLLIAEINSENTVGISDFDGTLYHKNDAAKTQASVEAFRQFPVKIICTARSLEDIFNSLKYYNLNVDWIIAYSGAVVSDGRGKIHWHTPLTTQQILQIKSLQANVTFITLMNKILQACIPAQLAKPILGLRTEIYQDKAFILNWKASKLRATRQLLQYINWTGRVRVFGDGKYDTEMLRYFDGTTSLL